MPQITIYTTNYCPYCTQAKYLLKSQNLQYQEIDVTDNQPLREQLSKQYNWQTVPLIIINDQFIGGYDNLNNLIQTNQLTQYLN